jgi:plasmid maintenance system killer protein
MIQSFACPITEGIANGEEPTRCEIKKFGGLDIAKTAARLDILNTVTEKRLLTSPALSYHKLHGTDPIRYSIDANSRKSKWRITFQWTNEERTSVAQLKIEDTHS